MKPGLVVLCLTLSIAACTSPKETSSTKSFTLPAERSTGSIGAMTAFKRLGFDAKYDKIKVCIQSSNSYSGDNLLLETKLAYAAWLNAGGKDGQSEWNLFEFELKDRCTIGDKAYHSLIIVASLEKFDKDQAAGFNKITCTKAKCSATGDFTTGLAGPGRMSKTANWKSIKVYSPSPLRISPYFVWISLEKELGLRIEEIRQDQIKQVQQDNSSRILLEMYESRLAEYKKLKNIATTVAYSDLIAYNNKLKSLKKAGMDPYKIINVNDPTATPLYRPERTGFRTLVHEVGHQFAMQHADTTNATFGNETSDSITYTETKIGDKTFYTTSDSIMAYGNLFFYLTDDDVDGIKSLHEKIEKHFKDNKPKD